MSQRGPWSWRAWIIWRTAPNGIGMFTWAFLDEGVVRDDLPGNPIDVQDQNAPDGMVGPYREREASYYTYKAIYNPVQVTPPDPGSFAGTLAVENRFSFTSLNQCTFDWQLGMSPDPNDFAHASTNALTGGFLVALESGSFAGPKVVPSATGSLVLPGFPANATNYDALRLTATDPFGNNLLPGPSCCIHLRKSATGFWAWIRMSRTFPLARVQWKSLLPTARVFSISAKPGMITGTGSYAPKPSSG